MVCVVMVDFHSLGLRDVDLQVRLRLHISKFVREEAYVVREIKVLQMFGKAPYNTSFMQGQLAHDVVQDNCFTPAFVINESLILPFCSTAKF